MAELTPLANEVGSLRLWEAEARRDTEEAEKAFEELSAEGKLGYRGGCPVAQGVRRAMPDHREAPLGAWHGSRGA